MIKVRFLSGRETREVSFDEAQRILEETYRDGMGGLVFDGKSNKLLYELNSDVEELVIFEAIIGGG